MPLTKQTNKTEDPGYPVYPPSEDIYQHAKEEPDIDPENISARKSPNEIPGTPNEKGFRDDMTAEDLDIPGNDDDESASGSGKEEDEENNYYSLGGDDHDDLDETNE
jgi:hypothetical protein